MKFSKNWLNECVSVHLDTSDLVSKLLVRLLLVSNILMRIVCVVVRFWWDNRSR